MSMFCCANCFQDSYIKNAIQGAKKGTCDFCYSKNVSLLDLTKANDVSDNIINLLQLYKLSDEPFAKTLKDSLCNDWNVFATDNLERKNFEKLIFALTRNEFEDKRIFSENVIIPQLYDEVYLNDYGVVRGLTWKEFSNHIKNVNRFHSKFNPDAFSSFLSALIKKYDLGTHFFRARIADNRIGFDASKMKAPPVGHRTAGRVNPEGMAVLYLSSDNRTVLYEVRASMYDFVSVADFVNNRELRIIDLSALERLSPFSYGGDLEQFAINFKIFQEISNEIAKPLRRSDSVLEYLPTQFIAEFIKSEKYDGVEYKSTISHEGRNIALFDERLVDCVNVKTVEITDMRYKYQ